MSNSNLNIVVLAALVWAGAASAFAQNPTPLLTQPEAKLIATLRSDASQKEKVDACRQLAVLGTKESVPALAALLPDEKLSHMARYALETIPDPSVDKALRDALGTLQGRSLVGVIGSIGVRRDANAVGGLVKRLQDSDADVAQAAARALGRIASPAAVDALRSALARVSAANQIAFCEGLLRCAETLRTQGAGSSAVAIYDQLGALQGPQQVRAAAVRGAILARGKDGSAVLRQYLQSKEYVLFAAAIRATYELPDPDVTQALAAELPSLPENQQILVLEALGKRHDAAALKPLSAAAKQGSKPTRIMAVRALAETGDPAAALLLTELLGDSDREISQAALDGFSGLQGEQVDTTVRSMLKSHDPARRLAGVELIGRRRMAANLPDVLVAAADSNAQVRAAAFSTVGDLGGIGQIPELLDLLPKLKTSSDLDAAEQALSALCATAEHPEACTEKLTARLPQAQPGEKSALLRVLSSVGGASALKAVRAAVDDPNADVHGAAVRALGAWKTADAAPDLLTLARTASRPTDQTLCLRSYLGLAANPDLPSAQRLEMCQEAAGLVKGTEAKRLLLGTLGGIESLGSLQMITAYLDEAATKEEASAAAVAIAEKLLASQKANQVASQLIQPLEKVAQNASNAELTKRANASLVQARKKASQ